MPYHEEEARRLVIQAGLLLTEKKLIARTWGNISARICDTQFVITPSGRAYDTLKPEDLVKVNIADGSYTASNKPSSECGVHLAAYQLRRDISFVIHTHQFYASAVCAACEDTPFAPCAAYGKPGSVALKESLAKTITAHPESKAFLMARHGVLCLGSDYDDAFTVAEELEQNCKALFARRVAVDEAAEITKVAIAGHGTALLERSHYIDRFCQRNAKLRPYIDDFAQIVGPYARCVAMAAAARGLRNRGAVLIRNHGALCVEPDAEAAAMIVNKNCAAALYAANTAPLSLMDAAQQRRFYLKKYAKRIK